MNQAATLGLVGALAFAACGRDSPLGGAGGVAIPDANLRAAIADALGKSGEAPITVDEVASLRRLDASNSGIRDLTGLESATSLTRLWLGYNDLSDLTPLAGLTSLTELWLGHNDISDVTPLAGLTNLTELFLQGNSIEDLTPVAGLTNLTWLRIGGIGVSDLTPLAGLTNLTRLGVGSMRGLDLTPLAVLTNLTELSLDHSSLEDLTPLTNLTSLTELRLNGNTIADLTPLAGLTSLTWLWLGSNSIADLTPLAGLTNLTRLALDHNRISDLTPLAGLTNLTWLRLGDNAVSDLTPLAGLTNLTELRLENNNISDLAPLVENPGLGLGNWLDVRGNPLSDESIDTHIPALQARGVISDGDGGETPLVIPDAGLRAAIADRLGKAGGDPITAREIMALSHLYAFNADIVELTGLEYAINLATLQLGHNRVSDLTPLAGLKNLTALSLGLNSISDLTPLGGLINLKTLYLNDNNVSDLTPLAGLSSLTDLYLHLNDVSDPTPLISLTNLRVLHLRGNSIADLTPLAGLTHLTTLELGDNSISDLPAGLFAGFADLETLDLASNPGAPFAFTLELERTDTSNRLAPGPAGVAVQLTGGAPFEMTVPFSVYNGSVSVSSLTIGAGDTKSSPVQVTAPVGTPTATHVVLDHVPPIPGGFTGIEVQTGRPLVLFAESDNHFPVAEEIPPHILQVGGPKPMLDVTEYFSDADGDELVYSVTSSDDRLVGIRVNGGEVTLTPRAEGHGSVVVTATDPKGLSASQELSVTVLPAPDPRSFDIDLVFVGPTTEEFRSAALRMAKRWTEVITGDLRDVPVPDNIVDCLGEHRFHGTVDDLVVFVRVGSLSGTSGLAYVCRLRDRFTPFEARRDNGSSLPYMGSILLDRELVARGSEAQVLKVILHEIGHVLGVGSLWYRSGFLQDPWGPDPHFKGPLAIEAFDAAGGTDYTGAKVPITFRERGGHWRFYGELMSLGGSALSAITVQSLADLGYVVDVSRADPYRLPGSAKAVAGPGLDLHDDILHGPTGVADEDGHVVRVIHR
ncbi:MAG: leucine-rich repeat domain-containing protein [Gemmatimonadaceae bacterium]|nr:leucine-rich repeat domain-containing protein [Gemmatimonadaceae bacterium]